MPVTPDSPVILQVLPSLVTGGVERGTIEIAQAIVAGHGRAYQPSVILFVPDIPKTRNMKIMRRVVRATYLGEDPGDLSSMVNPESLDAIRAARDQQKIR